MLVDIVQRVSEHWVLATFFGTFFTGENAIVTAFIISKNQFSSYFGIAVVAYAATMAADVFWYLVGRYGFIRLRKQETEQEQVFESMFQRWFHKHLIFSLLIIKFLVGFRLVLTVYLAKKQELTLKRYLLFNSFGIILFIAVLFGVSWLVRREANDVLDLYRTSIMVIVALVGLMGISHIASYLVWKWQKKQSIQQRVEADEE